MTEDEEGRLRAVVQLGLLGQPSEPRLTRVTDVTRTLLDVPMAFLNLVDNQVVWAAAGAGPDGGGLDKKASFCRVVVTERVPLAVADATADLRFQDSPVVAMEHGARAYAGHPLRAVTGEVVGTLCVIDVRVREWSDAELRTLADLAAWAELELNRAEIQRRLVLGAEAQHLNETVLSSAAEGICAIAVDGSITMMNPAAERLTGWTAAELLGRSMHGSVHSRRPDGSPYPVAECPLNQALSRGEVLVGATDVFWRRDGSSFPVHLSIAPILSAGEPGGAVVVFEDVTAQQEVSRLKEEFVSVVSHELRTPLTSLRGSLGLLAAGVVSELPPEAKQLVDIALSNTDRLVRLVGDILHLEMLSSGQVHLVRSQHRLPAVVDSALAAVRGLADAESVVLEQSVPDEVAWFDGDRVVQVLVNLLGNAIKFSPPGSTVRVEVATTPAWVRFRVIDHGRGIPPDKLETIFERFAQVESGDAREKGGSGLGLAISRSIAHAHRGSIEVESEVGRGTTFTVQLPQRLSRSSAPADLPSRRATDKLLPAPAAPRRRAADR